MIKVMIIEDDPMVRDINTKFLNRVEGFQLIKAASNLTDAQSFIKKHKLDLYFERYATLEIRITLLCSVALRKWL